MNKEEALSMLKMMYHSQQMKNAVTPETYEEEQEIVKKYEDEFPKKVFKLTWMNWRGYPCFGSLFPKKEETWILDSEYQLGYYAKYEDGNISGVIKMSVKHDWYDMFQKLLKENFENEKSNRDCVDGEGWEMVLYDSEGHVVHEICGYIYENEYLNRIVKTIKDAHQLSQFM